MSLFSIFSKKQPVPLPYRTDIHSHLVPGVDDGSPDVDHSLELVERMNSWGIERIITTPHITEESFENTPETLDPAFASLKAALAERGNTTEITRSSENRLDEYFFEQFAAGNITPMPNNHLLVECSFIQELWQLDQVLFDLRVKGYNLILAHPERYFYFHVDNFKRYTELHNAGIKFQVNVLSLAGAYSSKEKKVAEKMIDLGFVDFLGTDLHNTRHADAIDAYLRSSDARKHFAKLEGKLQNDVAFK